MIVMAEDMSHTANGTEEPDSPRTDDTQWVPIVQSDTLDFDKHVLLHSLPPGTLVLESGIGGRPGTVDSSGEGESNDQSNFQGYYLRPLMLSDNRDCLGNSHGTIPAILTRSIDSLDNDDGTEGGQEYTLVQVSDGTTQLYEPDTPQDSNRSGNHLLAPSGLSISNRSDLEGSLRIDSNPFIRDDADALGDQADVPWGQPSPVIRASVDKNKTDLLVNFGVRTHSDPWLGTFEDIGHARSPSGRVMDGNGAPEELSPLVEGTSEKIGDYLEAEDQEGAGDSSPPQVTGKDVSETENVFVKMPQYITQWQRGPTKTKKHWEYGMGSNELRDFGLHVSLLPLMNSAKRTAEAHQALEQLYPLIWLQNYW